VVEEITPILLDRLNKGHVDVVVLALAVRGEELISEELFLEPLFPALPEGHRLAERKSLVLSEIRQDPFSIKEGPLLPGKRDRASAQT